MRCLLLNIVTYEEVQGIKFPVNPIVKYMSVYIYYIDGLLIDTGPRLGKRKLAKIYKDWDINQVAITHYHSDHTGMVKWLERHKKLDIFCSEETIHIVNHRWELSTFEKLFSTRFNGRVYEDMLRTPNFSFIPIKTPGHTDDHTALYEPNKGWLFTGDLYVSPFPKVCLKEESISDYISSLDQLTKLDVSTIFCAHEGIISNGKKMLKKKHMYLEKMRNEVVRLHGLGFDDRAIVKKLLPDKVKLEVLTFGSFSRLHFVRSCYRDLEK